ncbi:MAG: efflux RND transporter periplasmic adaptor subunit [Idiomarina sp.]|nr:efflux RND transporter periplasmic adaptor subunit [Idiomarina sp.]
MSVKRVMTLVGALVGAFVGLIVVFAWLAGAFVEKVSPVEQQRSGAVPESTAQVIQAEIPELRYFSGTVQARQQAAIAARITAQIAEVLVEAGDRVEQGDLLLRLDSADLSSRVRQQEQALAGAQARANEARNTYQRTEALVAQGLLPSASMDEATAQRDMAEAELNRARAALSEAQTSESFSVISAPFAGVVSRRNAFSGDTATPGMVLLTMYQPSSLRLEAAISESAMARIAIGDVLRVKLDSHEQEYDAVVTEVEPAADAGTRSYRVRMNLETERAMLPGMYGRVTVSMGQREAILVPVSAITQLGQLDYVYVTTEHGPERRLVRLGQEVEYNGQRWVEVVSGVTVGSFLVLP